MATVYRYSFKRHLMILRLLGQHAACVLFAKRNMPFLVIFRFYSLNRGGGEYINRKNPYYVRVIKFHSLGMHLPMCFNITKTKSQKCTDSLRLNIVSRILRRSQYIFISIQHVMVAWQLYTGYPLSFATQLSCLSISLLNIYR